MITSILIFLQDIAHFNDLASIRKFTEAAGLFDGSLFCTIFRKFLNEQLVKLFNSLLRIFYRCIQFFIYCFCDLRSSKAFIFVNFLNYVVINSENYGSPNHTDIRMVRFFAILFKICIPIYSSQIIWNFIIFYVESFETLISTLKSIYGELWGIILNLVSNLIIINCGNYHDLRYFYFYKIFHENTNLFPYFNFFIRKFQTDHSVLYYFYYLKNSEVRGVQNQ
jgi:hypothetical protein